MNKVAGEELGRTERAIQKIRTKSEYKQAEQSQDERGKGESEDDALPGPSSMTVAQVMGKASFSKR